MVGPRAGNFRSPAGRSPADPRAARPADPEELPAAIAGPAIAPIAAERHARLRDTAPAGVPGVAELPGLSGVDGRTPRRARSAGRFRPGRGGAPTTPAG
ncbi:hypothetical protein ACFV4N_27085 [Actinosynnema sp. NPDC059797]